MKWIDSSIKLILCGSSGCTMPTYPEWDRVALELCYDHVDYLSIHRYVNNEDNDTPSFLASAASFEKQVDDTAATIRYAKAKKRSKKDVFISWDEWNVWYKAGADVDDWSVAPPILEEVYNLEDALVVATWLNVFLRKCDVVRAACLAQIVNVIGPLLTTREGVL
jgi:alpha-N-arabinofuranosidase